MSRMLSFESTQAALGVNRLGMLGLRREGVLPAPGLMRSAQPFWDVDVVLDAMAEAARLAAEHPDWALSR